MMLLVMKANLPVLHVATILLMMVRRHISRKAMSIQIMMASLMASPVQLIVHLIMTHIAIPAMTPVNVIRMKITPVKTSIVPKLGKRGACLSVMAACSRRVLVKKIAVSNPRRMVACS